jgi:FkbM family methyltransferase
MRSISTASFEKPITHSCKADRRSSIRLTRISIKLREHCRRFWRVLPRIILWRLISADKIDAFHRLPGLPFRMSLEPTFRGVGSLAVFSLGKDYEPVLSYLANLVKLGDSCIDCGANQGIYTLCLATLVGKAGHVIAVEPQAYATRRIRLSALFNGFDQIVVVEAAISELPGLADFHIFDELVSAGLNRRGGQVVRVKTTSIDHLSEAYSLQRISFIKLDVEGAELDAVKGARRVIARDKPAIVFELIGDPYGEKADLLWRELVSLGYRIFCLRNNELVDVTESRTSGFDLLALSEASRARLADSRGQSLDMVEWPDVVAGVGDCFAGVTNQQSGAASTCASVVPNIGHEELTPESWCFFW